MLLNEPLTRHAISLPIAADASEKWKNQWLLSVPLERGNLAIVRELLDCGADCHLEPEFGKDGYPFLQAIQSGNPLLVDELLSRGVDANRSDLDGQRPLYYAIDRQAPAVIIRRLIEHGADLSEVAVFVGHSYLSVFHYLLRYAWRFASFWTGWLPSVLRICIEASPDDAEQVFIQPLSAHYSSALEEFLHETDKTAHPLWYRKVDEDARFCLKLLLQNVKSSFFFNPSKCQHFEQRDFFHEAFFHAPGTGLAEIVVRHCSVEHIGSEVLHTLLRSCDERQVGSSDPSIWTLVEILLGRGVDPNAPDHDGSRPMDIVLEHTTLSEVDGVLSAFSQYNPRLYLWKPIEAFLSRSRGALNSRIKVASKAIMVAGLEVGPQLDLIELHNAATRAGVIPSDGNLRHVLQNHVARAVLNDLLLAWKLAMTGYIIQGLHEAIMSHDLDPSNLRQKRSVLKQHVENLIESDPSVELPIRAQLVSWSLGRIEEMTRAHQGLQPAGDSLWGFQRWG
jgi:ankyrin repeat protein